MFKEFVFPAYVKVSRPRRPRKRRTSDRGRMIQTGAVICAALGIDTGLTLIYQMFTLLLCLVVISRLTLFARRPLVAVKRRLPRYATAGEPFEYYMDIVNQGDDVERDLVIADHPVVRPPTIEQYRAQREPGEETRNAWDRFIGYHRYMWLQRFNTGIAVKQRPVPDINIRDKVSIRMEAVPVRRGVVNFRAISILHPDPFGLNYGVTELEAHEPLLIMPRRYRIPKRFQLPGGRHFQPGGINATWSIGESDEFASLRDYRDGDSVRKIHWPSTAKRLKPVVKEYQDEYFVRQALILDTHTDDGDLLEEVVSVAASFATQMTDAEAMLDLIYVSKRPEIITSGRGSSSIVPQLEALACVGPSALPVSELAVAVTAHTRLLSGSIVILCEWCDERRRLVDAVRGAGVAVEVFVVSAAPGTVDTPAYVRVLDANNIEEGLSKL